ncbi:MULTISPECIES: fimbrial biogenesis chaperone [unclassified Providencia]|uniref:fimbrial biogenesis chaperone n=1 Tax=unclassified Providencia TaxID=2633465 RepID=UPI00234BD396|nr:MULTISPECIES: fimbria/pilus periplasmic chaperone [unclassified Providencia]
MKYKLLLIPLLFIAHNSMAAVSLDRTRAIVEGSSNPVIINIENQSDTLPYLAQAWIDDKDGNKLTTGPLIATPLVQRLEPNVKSMIRISTTDVSQLPKDREFVYYFNLREIPPKSDKPNVMQVALQSRIKLFYRPEAILDKAKTNWALDLELQSVSNGYVVKNTSPFYLTVIGLAGDRNKSENGAFDSFMIEPFGSYQVKTAHFQKPYLTYINDYGGRPTVSFNCDASVCKADKQ